MKTWKYLLCGLLLSCLVWGRPSMAQSPKVQPYTVVTTFSILKDLAQQIGGDRVQVEVLVPAGEEVHSYQPKPSDVRSLQRAQLIFANGLGLDDWISRMAASAHFQGPVILLGENLGLRKGTPGEAVDPHVWQDVSLVRQYVRQMASAFSKLDPAGEAFYQGRALKFDAELQALDTEIRTTLGRLPAAQRQVVSGHDAFGYFAQAYGVNFIPITGRANEAEPSAAQVGALVRKIRQEKIPAIFLENNAKTQWVTRLQKETGIRLGGTLYADSLSEPQGPAPSYIAMMRHNLQCLMDALGAP